MNKRAFRRYIDHAIATFKRSLRFQIYDGTVPDTWVEDPAIPLKGRLGCSAYIPLEISNGVKRYVETS